MMHHGHVLTNSQYRQLLGVDSRVATRELSDLVGRDLIVQKGTRRWATYELRPRPIAARPGRRDRRPEIIGLLRDRGELSAGEIASALKVGAEAIRRWLRIMRKEHSVEATTKRLRSPTTKYRAVSRHHRRRAHK
jgi:ATP-dependent DNA helicase RecG